ncbi:MAG: hypothetical protein ACOX2R_02660 [Anaerolineae bacterium]
MQQLRFSIGVALLMGVFVIVLAGFIVTTRSDMLLILLGFTLGLLAVYAIERLKSADVRRQDRGIPRLQVSRSTAREG